MSWRGLGEPWLFDCQSRYGYKLVYLLFDLNVYVSSLSEDADDRSSLLQHTPGPDAPWLKSDLHSHFISN